MKPQGILIFMITNTYFQLTPNADNLTITRVEARNDPKLTAHQALQLILDAGRDNISLQDTSEYQMHHTIRGIANTIFAQYSDKYEQKCTILKWIDYIVEAFGFETDLKKLETLHTRIMSAFYSARNPSDVEILETDLLVEKRERAVYNAQICIKSELETGYIGEDSTFSEPIALPTNITALDFAFDPRTKNKTPPRNQLPDYIRDLTFEDDQPLPLDAEDIFLTIEVFNPFGQLKNDQRFPQSLHLPAAIFEDKDDGDVIRLKYKGQLVELEIQQQNHGWKFTDRPFKDALNTAKQACHNFSDIENPFFGRMDTENPYWFYTLGSQGSAYELEVKISPEDNDEDDIPTTFKAINADLEELRPLIKPKNPVQEVAVCENALNWIIDIPRFQSTDLQLIVNDKYILVYGRFEERQQKSPFGGQYTLPGREVLASFRWDRHEAFKGQSIDQIKQKITEDAVIMIEDGQLRFLIPV